MEGEVERRGRTEGVGGPEELEIIPLLFEEVVEAFKQTIFNIQCLHNHPIHDKVTRDRESPPPRQYPIPIKPENVLTQRSKAGDFIFTEVRANFCFF